MQAMWKAFTHSVPFVYMREFTNERSPMHVSVVEKPLLIPIPFKDMQESTWERNLLCVMLLENFH
jgi:hypothetical protein